MAKAKRATKGRRRVTRRSRSRARTPSQAIEIALAGLAHDIRTPLTGILGLSELLAASELPDREHGWAEAICDMADHLARLTTIVVDAAKSGTTGVVLRDEPFFLGRFSDAIARAVSARTQAKGLSADIEIAADLPERVSGDAVRLRSALENLIDNAVKFTERGRVTLSVSWSKMARGRLKLTFIIADSGVGISAVDLKRLFRPFAQASEDVARRYGGAGLGLVLVKRLAKAMGGDLVVTSKPGHGSAFKLSVVVKNAGASASKQRAGNASSMAGLRVLCVEDNPYGRAVHNAVLRELGHRVTFVGSGEAAVDLVAQHKHDVVVMDVALSGIDGIEATRRIRSLPPPASAIPIIGVSGRSEPQDAEAAKAAGMNLYLRKPATPAELNEALQSVSARRA